jgi:hypothetical protein
MVPIFCGIPTMVARKVSAGYENFRWIHPAPLPAAEAPTGTGTTFQVGKCDGEGWIDRLETSRNRHTSRALL